MKSDTRANMSVLPPLQDPLDGPIGYLHQTSADTNRTKLEIRLLGQRTDSVVTGESGHKSDKRTTPRFPDSAGSACNKCNFSHSEGDELATLRPGRVHFTFGWSQQLRLACGG